MRYVILTLVLGLIIVILAPYAQRLVDLASIEIKKIYSNYQEKNDD